ncbi:MAG: hypothetical protein ACD_21C00256G0001 [uncultured bacterium]|nr:MAG: hypothetical protein ACD_21C00256G0001 [uncultured bacterium]
MPPFVKKSRFCRCFDGANYFKPRGIPLDALQVNDLALDELEAVHLCDFDELAQETAAKKMKISTSTLQRLLYSGRKKIIDALYSSKALKISKHDDITEYAIPNCSRRRRCRNKQAIITTN